MVTVVLAVISTLLLIRIVSDSKARESLEEQVENLVADATAKKAEMTAKAEEVASLTEKVNAIHAEKTKIEEEHNNARANLELANAAKKALHDEMDKLAAELLALKDPAENTTDYSVQARTDIVTADILAE